MNKGTGGGSRGSRVTVVIPTGGLRKLRFLARNQCHSVSPSATEPVLSHYLFSAAIEETCAEAGIDMDSVAAPAVRTVPQQDG
jgi:hypothetical protein